MSDDERYPTTPDGRYFVVRGRLWRKSDPSLPEHERERLVKELMSARRAVQDAKENSAELKAARARVNAAKVALGERGPVWWTDGAADMNRKLARITPYADWYQAQGAQERKGGSASMLGKARSGVRLASSWWPPSMSYLGRKSNRATCSQGLPR